MFTTICHVCIKRTTNDYYNSWPKVLNSNYRTSIHIDNTIQMHRYFQPGRAQPYIREYFHTLDPMSCMSCVNLVQICSNMQHTLHQEYPIVKDHNPIYHMIMSLIGHIKTNYTIMHLYSKQSNLLFKIYAFLRMKSHACKVLSP